ncbi:hypothetical protein MPH_11298 [Macrophomina phaseolina MS6]|uniref:Uncharacterized protein n=1 Tax=Macrophomina phaseolina (strain MS6) TaxID=1126212 RepID=K2RFX9_MACPH|nr:hypothetical protein MPH_11298 [Macrophomina phaseolina MS6]
MLGYKRAPPALPCSSSLLHRNSSLALITNESHTLIASTQKTHPQKQLQQFITGPQSLRAPHIDCFHPKQPPTKNNSSNSSLVLHHHEFHTLIALQKHHPQKKPSNNHPQKTTLKKRQHVELQLLLRLCLRERQAHILQ